LGMRVAARRRLCTAPKQPKVEPWYVPAAVVPKPAPWLPFAAPKGGPDGFWKAGAIAWASGLVLSVPGSFMVMTVDEPSSIWQFQGWAIYPLQWLIFQSRLSPNVTPLRCLGYVFVVTPVMSLLVTLPIMGVAGAYMLTLNETASIHEDIEELQDMLPDREVTQEEALKLFGTAKVLFHKFADKTRNPPVIVLADVRKIAAASKEASSDEHSMVSLMRAADQDNDGTITYTELAGILILRAAARKGNKEAAQSAIYHLIDINNDGTIDVDELTLWVDILKRTGNLKLDQTLDISTSGTFKQASASQVAQRLMKEFDKDSNGVLDKAEFMTLSNKMTFNGDALTNLEDCYGLYVSNVKQGLEAVQTLHERYEPARNVHKAKAKDAQRLAAAGGNTGAVTAVGNTAGGAERNPSTAVGGAAEEAGNGLAYAGLGLCSLVVGTFWLASKTK